MTIYNREDARTALPQLEKDFTQKIESVNKEIDILRKGIVVEDVEVVLSAGLSDDAVCYKIGSMVFLWFAFYVTVGMAGMTYIYDLPHSPDTNYPYCKTAKFHITNTSLISDEAPSAGWHTGFAIYKTDE